MPRPLILLAPGAGAPSTSRWMDRWAALLGEIGDVDRFDYPYALAGRRTPDRLPVLVSAHRAAFADARVRRGDVPLVLAGKSMGCRVGCHVALEERVDALVCLGYPLRGQRGELRSEVLIALRTPVLFVQGSRDPGKMSAPSALHVVDAGNHSLEIGARELRARRETQGDVDRRALEAIAEFVRGSSRALRR